MHFWEFHRCLMSVQQLKKKKHSETKTSDKFEHHFDVQPPGGARSPSSAPAPSLKGLNLQLSPVASQSSLINSESLHTRFAGRFKRHALTRRVRPGQERCMHRGRRRVTATCCGRCQKPCCKKCPINTKGHFDKSRLWEHFHLLNSANPLFSF